MNEPSRLSDREVTDMLRRRSARPAPDGLTSAVLDSLASERARHPVRTEGRSAGRPLVLLAAAALLLVGGAVAAGSGLVRLPSLVPPQPAPSLIVAVASPTAAETSSPAAVPAEVGPLCRAGAPATLPSGPLPVTSRPVDAPANDGYLAVGDPALLDPLTGARVDVALSSGGTRLQPSASGLSVVPRWSPDGRWLALRWEAGPGCGEELIYSSDGTRAVDVTDYPSGRAPQDAAWSPDGRWLAVGRGDRVDVFGVAPDGAVSGARTVWPAPARSGTASVDAFGLAWGRDGTLAFVVEGLSAKLSSGTTVAFLAPGASAPTLVHAQADHLSPLAWTPDGAAVVAIGDVGGTDVGMFRVSPGGSARIPLGGLSLSGGKWADVPLAIVGGRIVFDGWPDSAGPNGVAGGQAIYAVRPDGSGLAALGDQRYPISVTFAAAPDGGHVAVSAMSAAGIWVVDLTDGSRRQIATVPGGIMDWQPVP